MDILKFIDFCSTSVNLKIKGEAIKKSSLGGCVSLLIIVAVLFLIIYLGFDIVKREKPITIISEKESHTPTYFNFTAKDFMFGFTMYNNYFEVINYENYLDVTIMNTIALINDKAKDEESPFIYESNVYTEFVSCDKIKDYESANLTSIFQTFKCIKNLTLFLGGNYNDKAFGTLDFIITPCQGKPTCKSEEEIKSYLNEGVSFGIYYRDHLIDLKNANNPIQNIYTPLPFLLSDLLQLNVNFYYKNLELTSDFGFLFENLNTTTTYKFDGKEIIYRSRGVGYYLWTTMYLTKRTATYEEGT